MQIPSALIGALRDAIPALVRALGHLSPLVRAVVAMAALLLTVLCSWLAVRYDLGTEVLGVLGSLAGALLVAALGAATDAGPKDPPPPGAPSSSVLLLLLAVLLFAAAVPGCAELTRAAKTADDVCDVAHQIVEHCGVLREHHPESDFPVQLLEACERAAAASRVCADSGFEAGGAP